MAEASSLLDAHQAERHRRVVIVVDGAHLLAPAQLEELRFLTNSDTDSRSRNAIAWRTVRRCT